MERYLVGDIMLDVEEHLVEVCGREVTLTRTEFEVMRLLMASNGNPVPVSRLTDCTARNMPADAQSLKVHICHMRRKMGRLAILSIYGSGYMVNPSATKRI